MQNFASAATDLGLGGLLGEQTDDMTEEEKRKKRAGLSLVDNPMNFGRTGVAAADLGLPGGIRR